MSAHKEESQGVVSLWLYEPAECEVIVESLQKLEGWNAALIREADEGGSYNIVAKPDVRSASTLISPPRKNL